MKWVVWQILNLSQTAMLLHKVCWNKWKTVSAYCGSIVRLSFMKRNSSSYSLRNLKDCFLFPALPVSHRKVFVSPKTIAPKSLRDPSGYSKDRFSSRSFFMRRIYEIHCDAMSEYEVQSFINTKAFQAWLHDKNSILTVAITRPWDSLRAYKERRFASWSTATLGTSHQSRSLSCR